MRVPPPHSLRIDRSALLRDLAERLQERAPGAIPRDPTSPAWLVLEEAAWMVETLSDQLDQYPWAVVQQLAHLLGVSLRPARPAVGVVAVQALSDGDIVAPPGRTPWRFVTLQSERRGLVEFELAEPTVPVVPARVAGLSRWHAGELWRAIPGDGGALPNQVAWVASLTQARVFAREVFEYRLVTSEPGALAADLRGAVERLLAERAPGWLRFEVSEVARAVVLRVVLDPAVAFEGVTDTEAGDVVGTWRALDDSTWTPPVRVADHPVLPGAVRGTRPLRTDDGALLVPGVPSNMLRNELLVRDARPAPDDVPQGIWRALVHMERKLAPLRPEVRRGVSPPAPGEPAWVDAALRGGGWFRITSTADRSFAHVVVEPARRGRTLRVAWAHEGTEDRPIEAFAVLPDSGMLPEPLPSTAAWSLVLPDPSTGRMVRVQAVTIDVPPGAEGVVTAVDGPARGLFLNAALVVNAPRIDDGRSATVERAVPDALSLMHEDVITREVLSDLADSGVSEGAARWLRALPVARFDVSDDEPILDYEGVGVDAADGTVTLLAPDASGQVRRLRRGQEVVLRWYRRTDGEGGNVDRGAISFVEQGPSVRPRLTGVTNPLPTAWGADREASEEAVRRVFGPPAGVPVTPADWEREILVSLGARARGWRVRVWGHAERALVASACWPVDGVDPETRALRDALAYAGPDTLLVAVGNDAGPPSPADLAWSREAIAALVSRWSVRLPAVRAAIVTPMHVLRLRGTADGPTPTHALRGLEGVLSDASGRSAPVPDVDLLLNAVVVGVGP